MRRIAFVLLLVASAGSARAQNVSVAYTNGQSDRVAYEAWFSSLVGDARAGAEYWAGQRSLSSPGSCFGPGGQALGDWTQGCQAAQRRLGPADIRRKTEPDYRLGWNSIPPGTPPRPTTASSATPPPAAAPFVAPFELTCSHAGDSLETGYYVPNPYLVAQAVRDCEQRRTEAQRQANEEQREAAFRIEAARAAAEKAAAQAAQAAALVAAETSPDNHCRTPDFAGTLIKQMDDFRTFKNAEMRVIDIEHLITTKWDTSTMDIICHGTFVFENDTRLTGTFEIRPNVAGDMITRWSPDQ